MKNTSNIPDISELLQSIEEVRTLCAKHESEICVLKDQNKTLKKDNSKLRQDNKLMKQENQVLKKENQDLRNQLTSLKHRKDSSNSSMPPSSDMTKIKRTHSLRKASGKKPGGQVGHKGSTLKIQENPDLTENYFPLACEHCGSGLSESEATFSGRRQVIDLPEIRQIVTEHRIYSKQCSCGHCTKSAYPESVKSLVSYGANIQSLVAYRAYLFNFLSDPSIPPDNNASERAIRNVKVKQKVSGFFKSFKGAQNYATLRSCIDTALKQGINPCNKLCEIAAL